MIDKQNICYCNQCDEIITDAMWQSHEAIEESSYHFCNADCGNRYLSSLQEAYAEDLIMDMECNGY